MLNDGWNEDMTAGESDDYAAERYRDAHPVCLECQKSGCIPEECPSGSCDVTPLITHDGELIHAGCVEAWNRHIENKCDGTTCHCPSDGIPLATDEEETTPTAHMSDAEMLAEHRALRAVGGAL